MATIFVSAVDGANGDNGTTWALAKQTVQGALSIAATNDTIVVDNAGTFTAGAANTWTIPAGNISIFSVTRSGTTSFTPSPGAIEQIGASSSAFIVANTNAHSLYVYGMTLKGGTNNSSACSIGIAFSGTATVIEEWESCTFDLPTVNTGTNFSIGPGASSIAIPSFVSLKNCTFSHTVSSSAGSYFVPGNAFVDIVNPTISFPGANKPLGLVAIGGTTRGRITIRDGDLSGFNTSGGTIFQAAQFTHYEGVLQNLKLSATPTIISGTWAVGTGNITIQNCDSADTTYTFQYINPYGTLTADETVYVTSSNAAFDGAGVSWKIVTTSLCNEFHPFITPEIFVWDTTLTSQTAEIEFIRDNATAMTDRDISSYLDSAASASFPNYTYQTNRNTQPFIGTTANQPTSSATWTGTGGFSNPTTQKLQNAFTAAAAGLLQSQVSVYVGSTTLYVAPFLGGVS